MTRKPSEEHAELAYKGQPYKILQKITLDSSKGPERMTWDNPTKGLHPTDSLCTCFWPGSSKTVSKKGLKCKVTMDEDLRQVA